MEALPAPKLRKNMLNTGKRGQGLRTTQEEAEATAHGMISCSTDLEPTCTKQLDSFAALIFWLTEEAGSRTVFSLGKAGTAMAPG